MGVVHSGDDDRLHLFVSVADRSLKGPTILRALSRELEPFKVPASIELWDEPFHGDRFKKMRNQT